MAMSSRRLASRLIPFILFSPVRSLAVAGVPVSAASRATSRCRAGSASRPAVPALILSTPSCRLSGMRRRFAFYQHLERIPLRRGEQHLPHRASALERPMRLRRVGQRIRAVDVHVEPPVADPA